MDQGEYGVRRVYTGTDDPVVEQIRARRQALQEAQVRRRREQEEADAAELACLEEEAAKAEAEKAAKEAEEEARRAEEERKAREELEAAALARAEADAREEAERALQSQARAEGADVEMRAPVADLEVQETGPPVEVVETKVKVPRRKAAQGTPCRECRERGLQCVRQFGTRASACAPCASRKGKCEFSEVMVVEKEESGTRSDMTSASRKRRRTRTVTAADTPVPEPSRAPGRRILTPEYWEENNELLRGMSRQIGGLLQEFTRLREAVELGVAVFGDAPRLKMEEPGASSLSSGGDADGEQEEDKEEEDETLSGVGGKGKGKGRATK